MTISNIYHKLMLVYTEDNLNIITHQLVEAYRKRDFTRLEHLAKSISVKADTISKLFTRLIMLYHPDRLAYYRKAITGYYKENATEHLNRFTHIFQMLEQIGKLGPVQSESFSYPADQNPYDSEMAGHAVDWNEVIYDADQDIGTSIDGSYDFISALKQKEYGNLDVVYRKQDLANTEGDLELSGYQIRDLSGLELCTNIVTLNLSNNRIFDITPIGYCHLLEEVDLSFNQIGQIEVLSELTYLKILDLSFNHIRDISALFDLNRLEYVNIVGNPISENKIDVLRKNSVVVVF